MDKPKKAVDSQNVQHCPPPNFNGYPDEDLEEFIDSFCSYLVAVGIDVTAGHADRVRAHDLFETCLKGDAKDWYERSLRKKNWKLRNLFTSQANLGATQEQTAVQLEANLKHGAWARLEILLF
ncbi:hypothetical protein F8M41_023569 [Gigaspora margarita]|uniref:Uncharacterized protein n=1 Tax=Gigaspora margarita TaxID=4874 RepID=A0A8H4ETA5_GIGMA|nr:hypothetical protein F8M41_023569 [Gigaspora margarita]